MPRKSKFPFFRIEDIPSPEQVELWASRQEWGKVVLAANAKNYSRPPLLKADSTLMMAARLLLIKQYENCLSLIESLLQWELKGISTRFLGNYSTAFVAANQLDRGIAFFQRLLVNLPEVFSIHYGLGELLAKAGRHEEAAAALERSIDLEPGEDNQKA